MEMTYELWITFFAFLLVLLYFYVGFDSGIPAEEYIYKLCVVAFLFGILIYIMMCYDKLDNQQKNSKRIKNKLSS
jgi:hypothetical protein